jgi:hypothetical protein
MERISRSRVAPAAFQWLVFPLVLGGAVAGSMRGMGPMTWWAQIRSPFRWAQIRSESAAR